jgi:histone acetyltransferase (RNA polymerase elongator complex component)
VKHANIPVFVPHLGCPNDCVFCNQRKITGKDSFSIEDARSSIQKIASSLGDAAQNAEIAFFGGSFTGIDRNLMIDLLDMAKDFCDRGLASGIRMSTRPDYINSEILSILAKYPVKTVELGIQSLSDKVLLASKRGHLASDSIRAMKAIKDAGFDLIGQMMVGLPLSTLEDEIATIKGICDSGADGIRIYPTTVFASTELCEMMKIGIYSPLSVEEAVSRTAELLYIAHERKVPVIRVGLCETDSLHSENGIVAGAFHPALGEMCMSEFFFKLFSHTLDICENLTGKNATIYVAPSMLSKAVGQKRININKLKEKYSFSDVKIKGSIALSNYEFSVDISD